MSFNVDILGRSRDVGRSCPQVGSGPQSQSVKSDCTACRADTNRRLLHMVKAPQETTSLDFVVWRLKTMGGALALATRRAI
jgi:hypothetical protein